jgi:hypothetical protein
MRDSIRFMYLDFLSIKDYLQKIILSFIFVVAILSFSNPSIINIVFFVFGINLLAYPFILEEQNHLDKFYGMLPLTKKDRIRGRYFLTIGYGLFMGLVLLVINFCIYSLGKTNFSYQETSLLMGIGYLLYFIFSAIELPILLKWGYTKARMVILFLPFTVGVGVPAVVTAVKSSIGKDEFSILADKIGGAIATNMGEIGAVCAVVSIIVMLFSYGCALRIDART